MLLLWMMNMAPFLLLIATQSGVVDPELEIESSVARARPVLEQIFDCIEFKSKEQLASQLTKASPASVVDAAIRDCSHLKQNYAEAVTSTYITPAQARVLSEKLFTDTRGAYIEQVTKWFISPQLAESRTKLAILEWKECVSGKAKIWSRLSDEATTIASAAVTSCREFRAYVISAVSYDLQSKSLSGADAERVVKVLDETIKAAAVEIIISERAKKLPVR